MTTSISGFGRLAYSLGEHGQLPPIFGRLHRRTLVAPASVVAAAAIAIALLIGTSFTRSVTFLASLFSFGVLLAFTAAQLAVIRLRMTKPDLRRPFRVPLGHPRARGSHPGAVGDRRGSDCGRVRRRDGRRTRARGTAGRSGSSPGSSSTSWFAAPVVRACSSTSSRPTSSFCPQASFSKILVPMKLGPIGEEMVATAVRLAAGRRGHGRSGLRDQGPARRGARRRALRRGRASGSLARRGARARRGQRGRGERADASRTRPRPSDRPGCSRERGGPDRARIGPALAPAVPVLLADGRLRAAQVSGRCRGSDRRLPAGSPRERRSALPCVKQ